MSHLSTKLTLEPEPSQDLSFPVLLLFEDELCQPDWAKRLAFFDPPPFLAHSVEEAQLIYKECENLGTPLGLVILCTASLRDSSYHALRELRHKHDEFELPILVVAREASREAMLAARAAGADHCYAEPIDWEFFLLDVRRATSQAGRNWKKRTMEEEAEPFRERHRESALSHEFWQLDLATRKLSFSSQFEELIGYSPEELGDRLDDWLSIIHPLDLQRLSQALAGTDWQKAPEELSFEFRLRHRMGSWRWLLMRGRLERDATGVPKTISGVHTNITRAKLTDNVTGLANRFHFEDWLNTYFQAEADDPGDLTLFHVGIDRYELIRDSMGQDLAEQVLRVAGERLEELLVAANCIGRPGLVARIGEDQFALCVPGMEQWDWARTMSTRVQDLLAKDIWIDGQRLFISTSIGYVVREGEITAKELCRDAEIAFHVARAGGGSLAVPFDDSLRQQTVERMLFEKDLKRALDNWEFEIYYQPKVTLTQLRTVGFEALIRWRHPERGIVPPSHFIPLAESNGLIIPIGIRTVREACLCLRQWHEQFPQVPPIEVSVNMSTLQFKDRNLIPEIRQILIDTGVPPESLKLEVTESVLVDNPERALAIAEELRRMGVGLKIDDFGTGYSSLSYLHRLPFDTLKIDRSFISGMTTDHTAFEIVRAIVALAQNLGLHVVAEGVETRAQMEELRTLGCDFGQGYLFAPPLNREAATRLLESEALAQARLRATL